MRALPTQKECPRPRRPSSGFTGLRGRNTGCRQTRCRRPATGRRKTPGLKPPRQNASGTLGRHEGRQRLALLGLMVAYEDACQRNDDAIEAYRAERLKLKAQRHAVDSERARQSVGTNAARD